MRRAHALLPNGAVRALRPKVTCARRTVADLLSWTVESARPEVRRQRAARHREIANKSWASAWAEEHERLHRPDINIAESSGVPCGARITTGPGVDNVPIVDSQWAPGMVDRKLKDPGLVAADIMHSVHQVGEQNPWDDSSWANKEKPMGDS